MRPDIWWWQPLLVFVGLSTVHRLLHLGCLSGNALFLRELHFTVLFAGNFWRLPTQLVRVKAGLVARMAVIFARTPDPVGAGRVQAYLLLL